MCATVFLFGVAEELAAGYETIADPANGYLVPIGEHQVLADLPAGDAADWGRQLQLACDLTSAGGTALSVFSAGDTWGLALAVDGREGPVAVREPDNEDVMEVLPHRLMALEQALVRQFPQMVDADEVDALLGALLDGAARFDDTAAELLAMLDCSADWLRWSWPEAIPRQLLLDPDLLRHVRPLGDARSFWEE